MDVHSKLLNAVSAYAQAEWSLDQFEDFFRSIAQSLFSYSPNDRHVVLLIEGVLAEFRDGLFSIEDLRRELLKALVPFDQAQNSAQLSVNCTDQGASEETGDRESLRVQRTPSTRASSQDSRFGSNIHQRKSNPPIIPRSVEPLVIAVTL